MFAYQKSVIPDTVKAIGESAFANCERLNGITIPASVVLIDKYAFMGCTGLTGISIPDSVTDIEWSAFKGCTGLTELIIPDSVKCISNEAFRDCTGLKRVVLGNGLKNIGHGCDGAFQGCTSLVEVQIGSSVSRIGRSAFCGCSSLAAIRIPDSVKQIDYHAFSGCSSLTSITIPDSVELIWEGAFQGCTSLKEVYIKNVWLLDKTGLGKDVKVIPTAAEGEEMAKVQAPIEIQPLTLSYSGKKSFQSRIRPGDEVKITLLGAREYPGSLKAWNPVWEMDDSVSVIFEEYYFEVLVNGNKRYIGQSLIERYTESSIMGGGVRYHVERDRINADSQKQAMEKLVDWMESGRSANNDWHSIKSPDEVRDIPNGLPYYPR